MPKDDDEKPPHEWHTVNDLPRLEVVPVSEPPPAQRPHLWLWPWEPMPLTPRWWS